MQWRIQEWTDHSWQMMTSGAYFSLYFSFHILVFETLTGGGGGAAPPPLDPVFVYFDVLLKANFAAI